MRDQHHFDPELELGVLSFAARLLFSDLDRQTMLQRALEGLADLGQTSRLGLFLLDQQGDRIILELGMVDGLVIQRPLNIPLCDTPFSCLLDNKSPEVLGLCLRGGLPWPEGATGGAGRCLCAPLVAADNRVVGMATFDLSLGQDLEGARGHALLVFLAMVAIALEVGRLFEMAVTDGLTGAFVRRYFDLRLEEEISRIQHYGGSLALLMLDLDHFKLFNDTHGHQAGDEVLRRTVALAKATFRDKVDLVCRYGGEEFAVIMPNTQRTGAQQAAERLARRFARHIFPGPNGPLRVSFSAGIACMDAEAQIGPAELVGRADQALYRAKAQGRDRVVVWAQALED